MGSSPYNPNPAAGGLITLQPAGAIPSPDTYLTPSNFLQVNLASRLGGTVAISARILLPTGEVKANTWQVTPPSDGSLQVTTFPLAEGFLLSMRCTLNTAANSNGVYAKIRVVTGAGTGATEWCLAQGYITDKADLAWPYSRLESNTDGFGRLVSITGTLTAAGVEISEVVPT